MPADAPATPRKPRRLAIAATTRRMTIHSSMVNAFTDMGCADRGRVSQNGPRDSEFRHTSIAEGGPSRFFDRAPYDGVITSRKWSLSTL